MALIRPVVALATVVCCAAPGVAAASSVTVDPATREATFAGGLRANDVAMTDRAGHGPFGSGPVLQFTDAAQALRGGAGCIAEVQVWCQALDAQVNLEGGNDRFDGFSDGALKVNGGAGDDHVSVNGNSNTVSGGAGADWLHVGGNIVGHGYGDGGDDDIASFASASTQLSGGGGNDLVYGDRWNHNDVAGDAGNDDVLLGGAVSDGTLSGGIGDDVMLVGAVTSFGASVTLSGGGGADIIAGQRGGVDSVSGDGGNDVVDVSGDARTPDDFLGPDNVACGAGHDTVYADADDAVAADCETRLEGPMPANARVDTALERLSDAFGVTLDR
jgi:hypothetical protein